MDVWGQGARLPPYMAEKNVFDKVKKKMARSSELAELINSLLLYLVL